jgi:hypothetical protein
MRLNLQGNYTIPNRVGNARCETSPEVNVGKHLKLLNMSA